MIRINLARLLGILHRRGINPHDVVVYWDEQIDVGFKRPLPRYLEPISEPESYEYSDFDDEED